MRLNSLTLSWFRGAADPVQLTTECKSVVVYGENGAGKSSFVDAIEYAVSGKIRHLAHEYSGRHQEKAVPNTHTPEGASTQMVLQFIDSSEHRIDIQSDGSQTISKSKTGGIETWDYRRTVLRQSELADFIHETKGDKYSTLLPLLGLNEFDFTTNNLRQLNKTIEQVSKLNQTKTAIAIVQGKRAAVFDSDTDSEILQKIVSIYNKYCSPQKATIKDDEILACCETVSASIQNSISSLTTDHKRYLAIKRIADSKTGAHVTIVRKINRELADSTEPLIVERLEVIKSADGYVTKIAEKGIVVCPACGQEIVLEKFQSHVVTEKKRLQEIIGTYEKKKAAVGLLCDSLVSLKADLASTDAKPWIEGLGAFSDNVKEIEGINSKQLRDNCDESHLSLIETKIVPIIEAAKEASKNAPPETIALLDDKNTVDTAKEIFEASPKIVYVNQIQGLIAFLGDMEQKIRIIIKTNAQSIMDEISSDVRKMWSLLHPSELIEQIKLYVPEDADKAIDLGLKFHGVELDSPRLTLSEGNRNSLGLCIFLSLAKRTIDPDQPLFLDDVVVSLDRNHRGMVAELIEKEFPKRQIVLLTHDRDWYTELRHMLNPSAWMFKVLLPYETPSLGIRWSTKTSTFDDARAHLSTRPDSAGNDARKIMDTELALIAEKLKIRLPYLRAEKNDHRIAHDFLFRLLADGQKCFQKKTDAAHVPFDDALALLGEADRLLIAWGNRGSHTFDLVRSEAQKLIDTCEKALEQFHCASCSKNVWYSEAAGPELVQCQCGSLVWRYGKG